MGSHPSIDRSRNIFCHIQYDDVVNRSRKADFNEASAATEGMVATNISMLVSMFAKLDIILFSCINDDV